MNDININIILCSLYFLKPIRNHVVLHSMSVPDLSVRSIANNPPIQKNISGNPTKCVCGLLVKCATQHTSASTGNAFVHKTRTYMRCSLILCNSETGIKIYLVVDAQT